MISCAKGVSRPVKASDKEVPHRCIAFETQARETRSDGARQTRMFHLRRSQQKSDRRGYLRTVTHREVEGGGPESAKRAPSSPELAAGVSEEGVARKERT